MKTITESKTKISKGYHGWTAETITTVNGQTFEITTTKNHRGQLYSYALPIEGAGNDGTFQIVSFSFSDMQKKIELITTKPGRVTEAAVKEQHYKAIAIFDEKIEAGEVQPVEKAVPEIGSILFLDGYGKTKGSQGNKHVVYEIETRATGTSYKTVEADTLTLGQKDYVKPFAEKFGIGTYFEPGYKFTGSIEDINNMVLDSFGAEKIRVKQREEAEQAEKVRKEEARKALIKEFPHLTPITNAYDQKQTKSNLVADLKHNFPGVRFSVTKSGYDCFNINWTNGPAYKDVYNVSNRYKSYSSDETGDFMDHTPDDFNRTFGGIKFVFTRREYSDDVKNLREDFNASVGTNNYRNDDYFYRFIQKQTIPNGAKVTGFKEIEMYSGSIEEGYYLTFEEVPQAEAQKTETVTAGDIQIVDYSEKAIAVIGETKPIKDQLKKLGGRFNFRLTCGAGWIFPKTKTEEVNNLLNNL